MKLVIGIVGENGSGKGTLVKLLTEQAGVTPVFHLAFSTILKDTLNLWGLPPSRRHLALLSAGMIATYGNDALAHAAAAHIRERTEPLIMFDGVRWSADEALIRSFPQNLLISITADIEVRFARLTQRAEKAGEQYMNFTQFKEEEKMRAEQEIPAISARADVHIANNDDTEALKRYVATLWKTHIAPHL